MPMCLFQASVLQSAKDQNCTILVVMNPIYNKRKYFNVSVMWAINSGKRSWRFHPKACHVMLGSPCAGGEAPRLTVSYVGTRSCYRRWVVSENIIQFCQLETFAWHQLQVMFLLPDIFFSHCAAAFLNRNIYGPCFGNKFKIRSLN